MFRYFSDENLSIGNGTSATISIKNWILLMALSLLSIIPIVGFIVYLVLYLMLAFRQETAPSISNFIKANLIISLIVLVLGFFVFGSLIGTIGALMAG